MLYKLCEYILGNFGASEGGGAKFEPQREVGPDSAPRAYIQNFAKSLIKENQNQRKREEGTESAGRPRARTERWGRAYKMKSVWRDAAEN